MIKKRKPRLTEVCNPDGDSLVENIEDHDHHETDDGGSDRRGHLRSHVLLYGLQVLQVVVSEFVGEGDEDRQAVHDDGHDGGQDQQNLKEDDAVQNFIDNSRDIFKMGGKRSSITQKKTVPIPMDTRTHRPQDVNGTFSVT